MKNIVLFASGRGSNATAIMDACATGEIAGKVVFLFSDNPQAHALVAAGERGVPTGSLRPKDFATKEAYETAVAAMIRPYAPDLICLAGYMRLIGATLLAEYPLKIMNIHPALLPSFPGLHAQRQAVEAGVKIAGCTVHFIDAGMDTGPIIAQTAVPVMDDDDEDSLAARILTVEHPTYVAALAAYCRDELICENGHVRGFTRGKENQ